MGSVDEAKKSRRRKKSEPTYGSYIYKVHKQTNPALGVSSKAVTHVNEIVCHILMLATIKSAQVAKCGKKSTLSAKHVQAAVPLLMGWELSSHAVSEGTKAVSRFTALP